MTTPPVTFLARDAAANTFTLSITGEKHTYLASKDGKRQAIVDSLQAIPLLEVGDKTYLPSNLALEVVAVVMYPDGIPNEAAFKTLTDVTEKACAHIGYGEEVELAPPYVPFTARGSYRPQFAPISQELIRDELEQVRLSFGAPCYEVAGAIVWNRVAQERHKKMLGQLPDGQQKAIATQVDALVTQLEWQIESRSAEVWYVRQATPDLVQARRMGGAYLARMEGLVCPAAYLREQLLLGAYGRRYYITDIGPELQTLFAELLVEYGYSCSPGDDQLRPRPADIPTEQEPTLHQALTQLTSILTPHGPALRVSDILRAIQQTLAIPPLVHWRVQRVLSENPIAGWLQQMGYQTEMTSVRGDQLQPPGERGQNEQVLLKTIRVKQDNNKRLSLADKLSVLAPVLTIDDGEKSLVYLEMVRAKQSVKANWAALVGGGKYHYVDGHTIILDGMKRHVRLQKTLPCGWVDWILLHKQASLKEMNPDQPFYLLDDGTQPIPPMFYPMLNRCLAVPVLPEWSTYLWVCGRERELITLLDKGEGQGYAAWKVTTAGVIMSTAYFLPYGGYRYPSTPPPSELTDTGFTGHKHNDSVGLIYMNARYYVPNTNRFLTPDSIIPKPTDPQSYNRYSYARNNPVNRTDPTGHIDVNCLDDCTPVTTPQAGTTPTLPPASLITHLPIAKDTATGVDEIDWLGGFGANWFSQNPNEGGCNQQCYGESHNIHTGLDFGADAGTTVYAAVSGKVVAMYVDKNGNGDAIPHVVIMVTIGNETYYVVHGHVDPSVVVGADVNAGDVIGTVSAEHETPHVHLSIRQKDTTGSGQDWAYNPLLFMSPELSAMLTVDNVDKYYGNETPTSMVGFRYGTGSYFDEEERKNMEIIR
ncbi:MAG: RHS repeat-associated core domain-containing protein [Microthrixaceae bacterium]